MMYSNKMAVAIKTNGRVLRENKETVLVPFGSEYQITLKNLNTVRAIINIYIDGDNVVEGGLVLNAGQSVDLERSIRGGNLNEGNKFKFIERIAAIEDGPRGIKLEDGIVRVEYQFEMPQVYSTPYYPPGVRTFGGSLERYTKGIGGSSISSSYNVNGVLRSVDWSKNGGAMAQAASASVQNYMSDNNLQNSSNVHDGSATMDWMDSELSRSIPKNDAGITVPGSKSTQKFTSVTMGALDPEKHVIVLKLLGETADNKPVVQPVTVNHKPECVTCGKKNKATASFCSACGTALTIYA
jgi:hypothetical protein